MNSIIYGFAKADTKKKEVLTFYKFEQTVNVCGCRLPLERENFWDKRKATVLDVLRTKMDSGEFRSFCGYHGIKLDGE